MYRDEISGDVRAFCIVWDITVEVENKKRIEQEMQVINGLASDCLSLYTINLDENSVNIYSISDKIADVRNIVSGYSNFTDGFRQYTENYIHEDDWDKIYWLTDVENIHKVLDNTKSRKAFVRRNVDGEWKWVEANVIKCGPVSEPARNLILAFTDRDEQVVHELDARKQLMESKEQLQQSLAMSNYFISSFVSAYYVDLNDASCTILKRTSELEDAYPVIDNYVTVVNEYIAHDVHADDREMLYELVKPENIKMRLASEGAYSVLFRDIMGGTEKNYRFQVFCGADDDHAAFCIMDVTEDYRKEKAAQATLEEALAMAQSANRAKTTFLNNMSHDIRTPMNAIIGYTGLAASHLDSKDLLQDYLKKIGQSSDHLLSLINDVLDMSRIESGKMNLDEKPENLSEIMHTLRNIVQADIKSKELDFFMDTADVTDENIICDKLRLNQILLNVLSNAIKYTQAGGTVSLRIAQKSVSENGYGNYVFHVKDNGMGMSEEFVKTIFDPFTRVRSTTVSGIQGTGLGMAITKNIVDMMGGNIDINSTEGEGTEVIIEFRFKLGEHQEKLERIVELEGLRSLVVDDDMNACASIAKMLKDCGMRSEWCASGKEAVFRTEEAVKGGDLFKVYIIDWLMPDMNGIETTRRIRRVVGDDAPIIILTAYDWSDIEEEAKEAGVTAFISKPLFPSDLHSVLGQCIGKEKQEAVPGKEEFDFKGKKILLVEDNEMNLEIAAEILEDAGFVIDIAEDGDIAVEKMKGPEADDYDLILMDIQMPRMDGYEATRQIRALPPADKHIPIIAMTANAFEEDRKASLDAGMDEHISKPVDIHKLKETLAKFLQ